MPNIGDKRSSNTEAVFMDRTCYNPLGVPKVKYYSKAKAKESLKRMVHRRSNGIPMQRDAKVYKCKQCNLYHIGHKR